MWEGQVKTERASLAKERKARAAHPFRSKLIEVTLATAGLIIRFPTMSIALPITPYRLSNVQARWSLAGIAALVTIAWLGAVLVFNSVQFVIFSPNGNTGFEVFLALGQLFAALVLAVSAVASARPRMMWVATGLLILGLGALGFGYLYPLIDTSPDLNVTLYGAVHVRTVAMLVLAIGLVPRTVPPLNRTVVAWVLSFVCIVGVALVLIGDELPRLVQESNIDRVNATSSDHAFPGLTSWHLILGLVPLIAGVAACWGAVHHSQGQVFGRWLVVAIVLSAGAQLHSLFWPSMYTSVLTTTSVLRFGLTVILITGGILELRYLSLEHASLLADEQKRVKQLQDLALLKRDFTSIVAHELATPLAAIGNLSQMISTGTLSPAAQQQAVGRIQGETHILQLLVKDIQASADVDRDDFTVSVRSVPLQSLIGDAEAYGRILRADHPLTVEIPAGIAVQADPERIGQVIRNLLNNALRHTPAGTPISLHATNLGGSVRIELADQGPGIDPADRARILEKFGRGRNTRGEGRGLGLYLSQRILQSHGTELTVDSEPGHGARFSFILKEGA